MTFTEQQLDLIDDIISTKIMNLKKKLIKKELHWVDEETEDPFILVKHWSPSRDCNAASSIMDSLPTSVSVFKFDSPMTEGKQYSCSIRVYNQFEERNSDVKYSGQTMPLAICGAALKVIDIDMEKVEPEVPVKKGKTKCSTK